MAEKTVQMDKKKLSMAGLLVAMGVVYGDIGTSPLYVMKAILIGNGGLAGISKEFILGVVSLIFWTLTLLTTVKYVMIALNADNKGEGGIFSLYTLVKRQGKYLLIPAMIGGAALLADGVLTPAVTVTTAIEGLKDIPLYTDFFGNKQSVTVAITLIIILVLFLVQRLGTDVVGKAFGPVMLLWFTFLGLTGLMNFSQDWSMIRALNPYYAIHLLVSPQNKMGLFILGSIFLATTGAEALYSDLGHVGKQNIRFSWPYVKVCLVLNYLGQAAWLMSVKDNPVYQKMTNFNPFFQMLPNAWMFVGVLFATIAAIIASQALISGSFTLISEAIQLKLLPKLRIIYPGSSRGQMYIPAANFWLWLLCSAIVLGFRSSEKMEAAYGLSITVTMLMTTALLFFYLKQRKAPLLLAGGITAFFAAIESIFFVSSAAKFFHGGYVAASIALIIIAVMFVWQKGNDIQKREQLSVRLKDYKPQLIELKEDQEIPKFQTNVVYLISHEQEDYVEQQVMYSILDKQPKRADLYWFVHVEVTDEPYTREYEIDMLDSDCIVKVTLYLGFRVRQSINLYLRQIVKELMNSGRIKPQPQKYSITPGREVGDFKFVLIEEELSNVTALHKFDKYIMQTKLAIKKYATSPIEWFGLEYSETTMEKVPLIIGATRYSKLSERK